MSFRQACVCRAVQKSRKLRTTIQTNIGNEKWVYYRISGRSRRKSNFKRPASNVRFVTTATTLPCCSCAIIFSASPASAPGLTGSRRVRCAELKWPTIHRGATELPRCLCNCISLAPPPFSLTLRTNPKTKLFSMYTQTSHCSLASKTLKRTFSGTYHNPSSFHIQQF